MSSGRGQGEGKVGFRQGWEGQGKGEVKLRGPTWQKLLVSASTTPRQSTAGAPRHVKGRGSSAGSRKYTTTRTSSVSASAAPAAPAAFASASSSCAQRQLRWSTAVSAPPRPRRRLLAAHGSAARPV